MARFSPQFSQLCQRAVLYWLIVINEHSNEHWGRDWTLFRIFLLIIFFPLSASRLSKSTQTLLCASFNRVFQTSSWHQSLRFPSLRLPSSVFPPCLQPQNKPKQNYQRSHGLGAKCWMCWIESFEVYRALRRKCHHWHLSLIFTPSSPQPHLLRPSCRSSMQTAVGYAPVCSPSTYSFPPVPVFVCGFGGDQATKRR